VKDTCSSDEGKKLKWLDLNGCKRFETYSLRRELVQVHDVMNKNTAALKYAFSDD